MQYTPGFAEGEMSQKNFGTKRECIHVLCSCGVHQARLHQCRTLCFRFTRSLHNSQPCSSDNCLKYTGKTLLLLHTEPAQQSTMLQWQLLLVLEIHRWEAAVIISMTQCVTISMTQCVYASMRVLLFLCLNVRVIISMTRCVIIFMIMQVSGPMWH